MTDHVQLVAGRQLASSTESGLERGRTREGMRPAGILVAKGYAQRDYYLRRLLALGDIACLGSAMVLAMALAGGTRSSSWRERLAFGLVTLPAWVVLFKMYGLYERDAKRLSHSDARRSAVAVSCSAPGMPADVVLVCRGRAREADVRRDPRLRRPGDGAGARRSCARARAASCAWSRPSGCC